MASLKSVLTNQPTEEKLTLAGAIKKPGTQELDTPTEDTEQAALPTGEQAKDRTKIEAAKYTNTKTFADPNKSMLDKVNQSFSNYEKALGGLNTEYKADYDRMAKDIDAALKEKKDARSKNEWMQIASMFANSVLQAGAAMYGIKHGINLAGVATAQPDFKASLENNLASIDDKINAIKEKQGIITTERKEKGARLGEQVKAGLQAELHGLEKEEDRDFKAEQAKLEREAKAERAREQAATNAALLGNKNENKKEKGITDAEDKLRKEWTADPVTKDTKTMASALQKIKSVAADSSAAGDLSLIFNYMKMLDPGSTVREGEQAMAQNAVGVPDRIRNLYNKALTGERLAEDQRKDFLTKADQLYGSQLDVQKTVDDKITSVAEKRGLDLGQILNQDLHNLHTSPVRPTAGHTGGTPAVQKYADEHFSGDYKKALEFLKTKRGYQGE